MDMRVCMPLLKAIFSCLSFGVTEVLYLWSMQSVRLGHGNAFLLKVEESDEGRGEKSLNLIRQISVRSA